MQYAVWRACERFGIRPPGVKANDGWDDLSAIVQADLIGYDQIRQIEIATWESSMAGAKLAGRML